MASSDRFNDMYDAKLKPKILKDILSKHVPNEKQPMKKFKSLPKVVSDITTHKLLSEPPQDSTVQKLKPNSRSAVDEWVERLLALVSSDVVNYPDNCSVGICLMGVTCQECSSQRFFSSYSLWFNSLLSHLKNPASRSISVASCAAISDLLTRLSRFSNTKKDAVSHAAKVILPIINLLEKDPSEPLCDVIVNLLSTIVTLFPAAFHGTYDKVEDAIASKMLSVKTSPNMSKKFAHFLALLPKANKGEEGSWSLMMQKLLISINVHLDKFFQDLEEETKGQKAIQRLTPPGKDLPSPLGGKNGGLDDEALDSEPLIVSRVSALMFCCSTMLTSSYKCKVNVPVRSLISLVERVLAVNGSLPRPMLPFTTVIQQELVCAELPTLHSLALELLCATIKSVRSQLLPYAASVVRLVGNYFRKCSLPELRIKLYSIVNTLLISMGVGMAMRLAQDVVASASLDLEPKTVEGFGVVLSKNQSLTNGKKRKNSTKPGVEADYTVVEVALPHSHPSSPISLKIAALEALETLLKIGGALGSDSWRKRVDNLVMTTARNACEGRWANAETLPNKSTTDLVEFQLAALRAFLASLVSPARVRPPFLAEGLELFQTVKFPRDMRLESFCAEALMSLEVVIHPRALPLDGLPSLSNQLPESNSHGGGDLLLNRWSEDADVPSNNKTRRSSDMTLQLPETKRSKLGHDLASVVSPSVQESTDMVASDNVQQPGVLEKVPETGLVSDTDATALEDESDGEPREGEDSGVKDSVMEEAATGEKKREEALGESDDDDSAPSLQEDDFLPSDSDIES